MDTEDQRDVEISTLSAIFPEIKRLAEDDPYTFTLDVPVSPAKTVTVYFPAAESGQVPNPTAPQILPGTAPRPAWIDSHELSHLPAVRLQISLPESYPAEQPPVVNVSTTPPWLPASSAKILEDHCAGLWEELGRDLVVFAYIDLVQQLADDVFGLVSDTGALEIRPEHKIAVLDFDMGAKKAAFDRETFDCGVCLDPKKGARCHRMLDCGHVFCIECLQDFYNNAITEGDLATVRCLQPNCAKDREAAAASGGKPKKSKTSISPSELLQIPLEPEMVKRYVTLKYKTELESDKNTIYCPRPWCKGAARSKKHKKPEGFELHEAENGSDDDDEEPAVDPAEASEAKPNPKPWKPEDRLAVCEDCSFAFCSRCLQSWHGDYVACTPPRNTGELSEEEKASLEFINLHTTPCPTCGCPAQKTHGCNHMNCFKCQTHFCYLCSAWLDPRNPYQHYNEQPDGSVTSCYMRLWELEEGDEGGGIAFQGGRAVAQAELNQAPEGRGVPIVEAALEVMEQRLRPLRRADANPNRAVLNGPVNLVHEGPRVFRLDVAAPREDGDGRQQVAVEPVVRDPQQLARGQNRIQGNARGARQQQPLAQAQAQRPQQPGQRGQAERGRGIGRQNMNQGRGRAFARRERHLDERIQEEAGQRDQLEDVDAAWVRQFVHLAMEDNEDLLD